MDSQGDEEFEDYLNRLFDKHRPKHLRGLSTSPIKVPPPPSRTRPRPPDDDRLSPNLFPVGEEKRQRREVKSPPRDLSPALFGDDDETDVEAGSASVGASAGPSALGRRGVDILEQLRREQERKDQERKEQERERELKEKRDLEEKLERRRVRVDAEKARAGRATTSAATFVAQMKSLVELEARYGSVTPTEFVQIAERASNNARVAPGTFVLPEGEGPAPSTEEFFRRVANRLDAMSRLLAVEESAHLEPNQVKFIRPSHFVKYAKLIRPQRLKL